MHREYWRKNLTITAILLAAWLVLTIAIGYYAHMGPQGLLVLYVVIIGIYAWYMNRLDRSYGRP